MPRTIQFTQVRIKSVLIDVVSRQVSVVYVMTDETGQYHRNGTAIFTRPLPDPPPGGELPEDVFLIPAARAQEIQGLVADIRTAMENKLLV